MACCRGRSSEGSQEERLPATDPDTCPRPLRPEAHLQTRMRGGVSASPAAGTEPTLLGGRGPQGLRRECDTSSCTGKMSPVYRADFACHGPRAAARASCRRVTDPAQPPPCLCSTHEPLRATPGLVHSPLLSLRGDVDNTMPPATSWDCSEGPSRCWPSASSDVHVRGDTPTPSASTRLRQRAETEDKGAPAVWQAAGGDTHGPSPLSPPSPSSFPSFQEHLGTTPFFCSSDVSAV